MEEKQVVCGGRDRPLIRKYPEKAQRPSLAQPDAVLQSAMRGLTTEFGMGSGDPSLYGCAISRYSLVKFVHPDICIGT